MYNWVPSAPHYLRPIRFFITAETCWSHATSIRSLWESWMLPASVFGGSELEVINKPTNSGSKPQRLIAFSHAQNLISHTLRTNLRCFYLKTLQSKRDRIMPENPRLRLSQFFNFYFQFQIRLKKLIKAFTIKQFFPVVCEILPWQVKIVENAASWSFYNFCFCVDFVCKSKDVSLRYGL